MDPSQHQHPGSPPPNAQGIHIAPNNTNPQQNNPMHPQHPQHPQLFTHHIQQHPEMSSPQQQQQQQYPQNMMSMPMNTDMQHQQQPLQHPQHPHPQQQAFYPFPGYYNYPQQSPQQPDPSSPDQQVTQQQLQNQYYPYYAQMLAQQQQQQSQQPHQPQPQQMTMQQIQQMHQLQMQQYQQMQQQMMQQQQNQNQDLSPQQQQQHQMPYMGQYPMMMDQQAYMAANGYVAQQPMPQVPTPAAPAPKKRTYKKKTKKDGADGETGEAEGDSASTSTATKPTKARASRATRPSKSRKKSEGGTGDQEDSEMQEAGETTSSTTKTSRKSTRQTVDELDVDDFGNLDNATRAMVNSELEKYTDSLREKQADVVKNWDKSSRKQQRKFLKRLLKRYERQMLKHQTEEAEEELRLLEIVRDEKTKAKNLVRHMQEQQIHLRVAQEQQMRNITDLDTYTKTIEEAQALIQRSLVPPPEETDESGQESRDETEEDEEEEEEIDELEDENGNQDSSSTAMESSEVAVTKKGKRTDPATQQAKLVRIWSSLARKEVPKAHKQYSSYVSTRVQTGVRLVQIIAREVKRASSRIPTRTSKELPLRAKRAMREMLVFWKKNEREEREARKRAEKEAQDRLKKEEERREAKRQQRKLNFLITQTELYGHFIAKKTGAAGAEEAAPPVPVNLQALDFDDDDESKIEAAAHYAATQALKRQQDKTRAFDEEASRLRAESDGNVAINETTVDQMDFLNPSTLREDSQVDQPQMLQCKLKGYQLKGLNWLANLYEQGINGILADEMGLGKTVQSISLMAYLAETHNIWGPFLVISPVSTLHNWQQEITKFAPALKPLPYWGSQNDRKILRKYWSRKKLYSKEAPCHVVITSYQLVVTDEKFFQKVKWQYMILDEAQAIKSSSSQRWNTLLKFHCRNRLLLTGTPIQNSMQELWALLHFIMPTLFDSHEEFSEWFSRDIESHAQDKGSLNEHQLMRLHMILKPFMLRRIKKDVENELGDKIEIEVKCHLTARQRRMYRGLKEKISVAELLEKVTSLSDNHPSMDSLMNLVMQFRKVCNHPELFERADVASPFTFVDPNAIQPNIALRPDMDVPIISYSPKSGLEVGLARCLYRFGVDVAMNEPLCGSNGRSLNIWSSDNIQRSMVPKDAKSAAAPRCFSFVKFLDVSAGEVHALSRASLLARWAFALLRQHEQSKRWSYLEKPGDRSLFLITEFGSPTAEWKRPSYTNMSRLVSLYDEMRSTSILCRLQPAYLPAVLGLTPQVICADRHFTHAFKSAQYDHYSRSLVYGYPALSTRLVKEQVAEIMEREHGRGMVGLPATRQGFTHIHVPAMEKIINDSGKMLVMDQLLKKLKAEGHRVLIYFQMTKMIDIAEEYLAYRQYQYLRLDGSVNISQRRDMVSDWQSKSDIFVFLLSTRAGGLGINLTAADTVIFYDSDWNPTVDQQAMDRAHRLGQTKQVTVYRLVTQGTIEEKILLRAKQKDAIQKTVISGGDFKMAEMPRPKEMMLLLLDDDENEKQGQGNGEAAQAQAEGQGQSLEAAQQEQAAGAKRKRTEEDGETTDPNKKPKAEIPTTPTSATSASAMFLGKVGKPKKSPTKPTSPTKE